MPSPVYLMFREHRWTEPSFDETVARTMRF
jgi:hypothetical protein